MTNRTDRTSSHIANLEREYVMVLEKALRECAADRWGLFGQNEHLGSSCAPVQLGELRALAQAINRLHARTGLEVFALHERFEAARGPAGPNDLGEARLAADWLKRLSASSA